MVTTILCLYHFTLGRGLHDVALLTLSVPPRHTPKNRTTCEPTLLTIGTCAIPKEDDARLTCIAWRLWTHTCGLI